MCNRFNKNVIFPLDLLCVFHWCWLTITDERRVAGREFLKESSVDSHIVGR
jgi:hypothetical protein